MGICQRKGGIPRIFSTKRNLPEIGLFRDTRVYDLKKPGVATRLEGSQKIYLLLLSHRETTFSQRNYFLTEKLLSLEKIGNLQGLLHHIAPDIHRFLNSLQLLPLGHGRGRTWLHIQAL